jgi:hypothetical protein
LSQNHLKTDTQDPIMARRPRITAILRRRRAIHRQRPAMPCRKERLLETQAYCKQRYRSYNPQTGTYLGTDGQRHHCP